MNFLLFLLIEVVSCVVLFGCAFGLAKLVVYLRDKKKFNNNKKDGELNA